MGKFIDLTGQRFERLVVTGRAPDEYTSGGNKKIMWYCDCDCGTKDKIIAGGDLRMGHIKSCGCYRKEIVKNNSNNINKKYKARRKIKQNFNTYDLTGEYGIGWTKNYEEFYFDLEDYELIKNFYWYINANGYVQTNEHPTEKLLVMHHLIMNSHWIDHENNKRVDNRKSNLRHTDSQGNNRNRKISNKNKYGVIGITYRPTKKKPWYAIIKPDVDKNNIAKTFLTKEEAIIQRLLWEKQYYGEFAPQKHLFEKYNIN